HPHVADDDVGLRGAERLEARLAPLRHRHLVALLPEEDPEGVEDPGLVVDDQHRGLLPHRRHATLHLTGRYTVNVVPRPGAESTRMRPRWASTARCTTASPRPVPPGRPVTHGSTSRSRIAA